MNGTLPLAPRVRGIAMYLPQFHPVAENDEWWGRGFTEWTNVAGARPIFPGHYQPHLPGELGFYDLRLAETRDEQAALARAHGIEAFCYWHYWFAGRRMLERVVDDLLASGRPDLSFCLAWANENWTAWSRRRTRAPRSILIEQTYPGEVDHRRHFDTLLPAFSDPRYVRVDGKPLFYVYRPEQIPDLARFADLWRQLAEDAGLPGLYLVGQTRGGPWDWDPTGSGLDGAVTFDMRPRARRLERDGRRTWDWMLTALTERLDVVPAVFLYRYWSRDIPFVLAPPATSFPSVVPGWDNTSRMGRQGFILHGATPELFGEQVARAVDLLADRPPQKRLLFVRSWNEWAEGNHMEPDRKWGRGFLEAFRDAVTDAC